MTRPGRQLDAPYRDPFRRCLVSSVRAHGSIYLAVLIGCGCGNGVLRGSTPPPSGTDVRRAFDTLEGPPEWEFYDLKTDPWEFTNLAGKAAYQAAQKRLTQALLQWRKATDDPFLDPAFLERIERQASE